MAVRGMKDVIGGITGSLRQGGIVHFSGVHFGFALGVGYAWTSLRPWSQDQREVVHMGSKFCW
jgi:hypothetical protein